MTEAILSDDEKRRIREAVQAAERRTRAEIVPMLVPASARYREAEHRAGLIAALVVLAALLSRHSGGDWMGLHPGWILLATAAAYAAGTLVGRLPWAVRALVSSDRMAFKVRRRAETAFHEHGLHRTRERTGVLILVSLLEQRVQIVADRGIHGRVAPGTWDAIVGDIVNKMRNGRAADALCDAVVKCGEVLARYLPDQSRNPNELSDEPIG